MSEQEFKIIIAQINLTVGDIENNKNRIIHCIDDAERKHHADLVIFPELAVTGYPPEDLLLRSSFQALSRKALQEIIDRATAIDLILSYPEIIDDKIYNSCSYISKGKISATYRKKQLPNYGVFDEKRYFTPGNETVLINLDGIPTALGICEDLWTPEHTADTAKSGAKLLINVNASPYEADKQEERVELLKQRVKENGLSIIFVNLVGGQDELVFDGGSMVINDDERIVFHAPQFEEGLYPIKIMGNSGKIRFDCPVPPQQNPGKLKNIYGALILGTRDYVQKNGFNGAVIGLSGGIDSALTLAVAVDAIGSENIEVLMMPSRFTSEMSIDDAVTMAEKLNVKYHVIPIEKSFTAFLEALAPVFSDLPEDTTEENIQARCRGILLMAISNKTGKLVLTTGNKSEMAVGYATLYGDMAGGFAPLKDVSKTLVYELSNWRNQQSNVIPQRVIDRPPSAELKPDQKDEDSLPPYDILDPILERYIECDQSPDEIIHAGYKPEVVHEIIRLVDRNEYKRRQAAPGVKITRRAFGRNRRYPITSGYKEF